MHLRRDENSEDSIPIPDQVLKQHLKKTKKLGQESESIPQNFHLGGDAFQCRRSEILWQWTPGGRTRGGPR